VRRKERERGREGGRQRIHGIYEAISKSLSLAFVLTANTVGDLHIRSHL